VKAFLKAGILGEDGAERETITGTPQGGILSPLLSNIALSILDEHFAQAWEAMGTPNQRHRLRAKGFATYRLVRYADDFVVMVAGTKDHAEALLSEVAAVLGLMGLRLSESKTRIVHIDEGFDFLGWRIQRHQKRGTAKSFVYTYPAKKALASIVARVRALTHRSSPHPTLAALIHRLNPMLRGWCAYFRYGVSSATFGYLAQFTWRRVLHWLRKRHPRTGWKALRRRYLPGWQPTDQGVSLLDPGSVTIIRYRYRGTAIPTPWMSTGSESHSSTAA
jgi:RNA-directed DNA polymerase